MPNQDSGAGQHYDEDMLDEQWSQQGGQVNEEEDSEGVMPKRQARPDGMGRQTPQGDDMSEMDQWEQQRGLSGQPFSPLDEEESEESLEEEEEEWEEEEDVSHLDQM